MTTELIAKVVEQPKEEAPQQTIDPLKTHIVNLLGVKQEEFVNLDMLSLEVLSDRASKLAKAAQTTYNYINNAMQIKAMQEKEKQDGTNKE